MVAHVDVGKQRIESVKAKMVQNICIFNEWKLRYWGPLYVTHRIYFVGKENCLPNHLPNKKTIYGTTTFALVLSLELYFYKQGPNNLFVCKNTNYLEKKLEDKTSHQIDGFCHYLN